MKSEEQMPETLKDLIRKRGAPDVLISDNAKAEVSGTVMDILRTYFTGSFQSEPNQQNQNPAERRIQDIKQMSNTIMDRTGTPSQYWILVVLYVIYLWNHIAMVSLGNVTPIQIATGVQPDISALLHFRWWEPVYYYDDDATFPSQSREKRGRWCGVAENVGDVLTFNILTDDTQQVIQRSVVKSALDPFNVNFRAEFPENTSSTDGEKKPVVTSSSDIAVPALDKKELKLPTFSPDELIGRTFLMDTTDNQRVRAEIVRKLATNDAINHKNLKFLVKLSDDVEEVIGYTELCDAVEEQHEQEMDNPEKFWTYKEILNHQGPLTKTDSQWKGSIYNILLKWEDGSETWEPLNIILKDDPVTCANYALKNDLLHTHGWTTLRKYAKNKKKLARMNKQIARAHKNAGPKYKFGVEIPRNSKHARQLQEKLGHTKWTDAEQKEIGQLNDYTTFIDKGKRTPVPRGYRCIRVRFVYDCKHDLRHKARLVAGGHLTPTDDSAYSGVVSLKSMRLALLIGEMNGLRPMVGDIGNAYLEAYTQEKVCFYAGPEFGPLEGHLMIISKALYGLRSSGARFHDKLYDTLVDMNFRPSYADPDLWLRDAGDCYEYVCVYVDDLMAIMKDPQEFFDLLVDKYKYILKGVGDPEYHLGGNFGRDPDGTLYWSAKTYVKKMMDNYERIHKQLPTKSKSPLDKNDHPELDQTPLLEANGIKMYQSMIGALQWAVTLGRFDIACAVMCMSRFRASPRTGHLQRLHRLYGYLRYAPDAAIRFRTGIPDNETLYPEPSEKFDWSRTVYGPGKEEIPDYAPAPKGKVVRHSTFVDANLMHCLVTGKACTGVIHLVNGTPIDWYAKRQGTVETATYSSEFVAARTATEQVIDIRLMLMSMGVPIDGPTWMMGDNASVIMSGSIPASLLKKRHNALSYHRVRSAIACNIITFRKVKGTENPSDVCTKFLPYAVFYPLIQPLLFCKGETMTQQELKAESLAIP